MRKPRLITLTSMVLAAALARLLPHPWNVTPVAAMGLFGGAQFSDKRMAFLVPLAALALSDVIIGFYPTWFVVYAAFAGIVLIGTLLQKRKSFSTVAVATLSASVGFFLLTNFGDWMLMNMYPHTSAGLIACYSAAVPFFRNTLMGDAFFSVLLFGSLWIAERQFPALRETTLSTAH